MYMCVCVCIWRLTENNCSVSNGNCVIASKQTYAKTEVGRCSQDKGKTFVHVCPYT